MKTWKAKLGAVALCALFAAVGGVSFAGVSEAGAWDAVRSPAPAGAEGAIVEKAQYYRYRRYPRCRTQCVTWSRYGCLRWRTYCY
jgi:hypothetical protein